MPILKKFPDTTWKGGKLYVRTATGWKLARALYRKTSSTTWSVRENYDTSAPGQPVLVNASTDQATKKVSLRLRMPTDADVSGATLKVSSNAYPANERDSSYIGNIDDLVNRKSAGPGQDVVWTFTLPKYSTSYYCSAWAVDSAGNASDRRRTVIAITPPAAAPPPSPTPIKVTYNAVTSGAWSKVRNYWNTGFYGDMVAQAGVDNHIGGWFYGGKIKAALSSKTKITKMTIRIGRASSAHGVSGPADVYLVPHKLDAVGQGSSPALVPAASPVKVGTLGRGESKVFNVPSAWWPHFVTGNYTGLAIHSGSATDWTSPSYIIAYGKGTTSGQVYFEAV